jgi:NADH-quinone oxidoreductase subunit A
MSPTLVQYVPMVVAVAIAAGLGGAVLVLNALLGPKRKSAVKELPFECGNPPAGSAKGRFSVKYYLVALFFLVFDVEVVFLLPWAVEYRKLLADPALGIWALIEVLIFVGVLALGLLYVWKRRALEWE